MKEFGRTCAKCDRYPCLIHLWKCSCKQVNTQPNPYETDATADESTTVVKAIRWRIAPALVLGILGMVGVVVAAIFAYLSMRNCLLIVQRPEFRDYMFSKPSRFAYVIGAPVLCAAWGVTWICSARRIWQRRWRWALVFFIAGAVSLAAMVNLPIPK